MPVDEDPSVAELIDQGCEAAERGRVREAERAFLEASKSGDSIAFLNLGNTYSMMGRLGEAVAAFGAALEGGEASAAYNLGRALEDLDRIDEALIAYRRAADAGDDKGAIGASWIINDRGDRPVAYQMLREAAAAGGDLAAGVLGIRLWREERAAEAEGLLRRAQDIDPDARAALASVCMHQGRTGEALKILREGTKQFELQAFLPPGNLLADVFQNYPEAIYRMAISLGDNNSVLNLGLMLHKMGRHIEGIALLEKAASAGDSLAEKHLEYLGYSQDEEE